MKRKLIFLFLVTGMIICSSCSDFLDTESPSEQTPQTTFENEGMTRSAIMGIYSQMCNTYVYGQKMSVNWQGVSDIELASGYSTDASLKTASGDTPAANYWCNSNNNTIIWKEIFKFVELASTAVEGIRNSNLLQTKPESMKRYLGEALSLRSLAYFELVRRWGDVPYRNETSNSDLSNVYMGKIDRDSIYNSIITDMQEAVNYLPYVDKVADYNCERITKGFAKGLLARIALFAGGWSLRDKNQFPDLTNVEQYSGNLPGMEEINGYYVGRPKNWQDYYKIAEQQCAELLADPENPHQLDPDYGNIWKTVCHLDYNPYNENLFEVANGAGQSGDIGTLMGCPMDGEIGFGSRGFGGSYVSSNGYYFYSFDKNDKRRDYAVTWTRYGKNSRNSNTIEQYLETNMMSVKFGKWNFFWTNDAYRAIALTATSRTPTGINWILMRYSDIYLMFAEARYALEGADVVSNIAHMSAREALEKVRERAFGSGSPEITNYDPDFFEAIVHERAWEFGCEGIRKLDLVRWGLLDKKLEDMKEAMVLMYDGTRDVKIFDKTYAAGSFPEKIYYAYQANDPKFVDLSSVNFYTRLTSNPDPSKYREADWFPKTYWNESNYTGDKLDGTMTDYCKILIAGSGLRASYDYSSLFGKLKYGSEVQNKYENYKVGATGGNGVCNYRHLYSIYYEDITKAKGYLSNSYGY